jgi:hypothetical protein
MEKVKNSPHGNLLKFKNKKRFSQIATGFLKKKSNLSNEHKYVPKGLGNFEIFYFNGQNRDFLPYSQAIFFKLKIQSAPFSKN